MKKRAASSVTGVSSGAAFSKSGTSSARALRVHDGAGKLMRADFAAFFEDVDIFGGEFGLGAGFVVFVDEVGEMQGAGRDRRARRRR